MQGLISSHHHPACCLPLPRTSPPPPPPPAPRNCSCPPPLQDFDPTTRKASILYTTGEAEELSLEEVIKDGHMSLINIHR